jgi:hypothetical protein
LTDQPECEVFYKAMMVLMFDVQKKKQHETSRAMMPMTWIVAVVVVVDQVVVFVVFVFVFVVS